MIWPADTAAWLVDLASATGQAKGMMILAGMSMWYSVALAALGAIGAGVVALVQKPWRK